MRYRESGHWLRRSGVGSRPGVGIADRERVTFWGLSDHQIGHRSADRSANLQITRSNRQITRSPNREMTMTSYLHYDVFTSTRFEGNQLAVFPDARGMSAADMQMIAREMNFSESTFLLPAEMPGTDIRMRIFTPGGELPMAGHPTIGTTFALADSGVIRPGTERFVFGLGVGPTPVELTWVGSGSTSPGWIRRRRSCAGRSRRSRIFCAPSASTPPPGPGPCRSKRSRAACRSCTCRWRRARRRSRRPGFGGAARLRSAFPDGHNAVFLFSVEPRGAT